MSKKSLENKVSALESIVSMLLREKYPTEEDACSAYEHAHYLYMMDMADIKPDPKDFGVAHRYR